MVNSNGIRVSIQDVRIGTVIIGPDAPEVMLEQAAKATGRGGLSLYSVSSVVATCNPGGQSLRVTGVAKFGTEKADVLIAQVYVGPNAPADPDPALATMHVPDEIEYDIPDVPINVQGADRVIVWAYSSKSGETDGFNCGSSSSSSSSSSSG